MKLAPTASEGMWRENSGWSVGLGDDGWSGASKPWTVE